MVHLKIALQGAHELLALLAGLEATVTELGGSIDELELDVLEGRATRVDKERLAEGDNALLGTSAASLDHDVVLVDDTVVGETTHGGDGLLGQVVLGLGVGLVLALSDAVDLLVDLSTVVVTVLTSARNREHDAGRMPSSDTGNLAETLVSLTGELLGAPTVSDTLETVTLGDGDDIDHLVLLQDRVDVNGLLKVLVGEVDLVGDGTTVQLDLHDVSLLLANLDLADLSVDNDTDDSAVLLDALELAEDGLGTVGVLLGVLSEGLLLGAVPVLVEATLELLGQVLGPDGGQRAETAGSLDVTDNTDNNHGGGLDDGDGLDDLLLVHLGTGTVQVTDDVGHTGLVTHEGGQVDGLGGIILGEGLGLTLVAGSTLAGQETQGSVTWPFEFTVSCLVHRYRQGNGQHPCSSSCKVELKVELSWKAGWSKRKGPCSAYSLSSR